MPTQRQERVQRLLREEISQLLLRRLKDPRLHLVSLTDVEVSPDLRSARVFVSVLGDAAYKEQALKALRGAAGFVREALRKTLRLRHIPELQFFLDEALERGARVWDLLEQVARENRKDQTADPGNRSPDQ